MIPEPQLDKVRIRHLEDTANSQMPYQHLTGTSRALRNAEPGDRGGPTGSPNGSHAPDHHSVVTSAPQHLDPTPLTLLSIPGGTRSRFGSRGSGVQISPSRRLNSGILAPAEIAFVPPEATQGYQHHRPAPAVSPSQQRFSPAPPTRIAGLRRAGPAFPSGVIDRLLGPGRVRSRRLLDSQCGASRQTGVATVPNRCSCSQ